jgi:hypothetical protein
MRQFAFSDPSLLGWCNTVRAGINSLVTSTHILCLLLAGAVAYEAPTILMSPHKSCGKPLGS